MYDNNVSKLVYSDRPRVVSTVDFSIQDKTEGKKEKTNQRLNKD